MDGLGAQSSLVLGRAEYAYRLRLRSLLLQSGSYPKNGTDANHEIGRNPPPDFRVAEALPWLLLHYPEFDADWLFVRRV